MMRIKFGFSFPFPLIFFLPSLPPLQYTALIRRFRDVMEEYNQVQDEYRERSKDRIHRQLKYGTKLAKQQMFLENKTNLSFDDVV